MLTEPGLGVIIGAIEEARRIFERMQSYATFRIAETTRMVVFIAGTIVLPGHLPGDGDHGGPAGDPERHPDHGHLHWTTTRTAPPPRALEHALGAGGRVDPRASPAWSASLARPLDRASVLTLDTPQLQTLLFLKLLVAGHMTIYVTRVRGWFWQRPWPTGGCVVALEATQVLGTLVAVLGWLVTPIPLWLALALWGYAIVWMFILSGVRVLAFRRLRPKTRNTRNHNHRSLFRAVYRCR